MINIKQLAAIDPHHWPNVIHMGYMTEVIRRTGLEWNQETPCPAQLQPYLTAVQTAFQREDQDYQVSQKSDLTALIDAADTERDALLSQVLTMVDAMAKMEALPAKKQAATTMKQLLDFYKPSAKMALREETTQIQQWYQAYDGNMQQEAAASELGLTQIIAQLVAKNTEVETLMGQRDDEWAQKAEAVLAADRQAVDEAMRDFTLMLNALALTDDDPARFDQIITGLTETQSSYQQRYEEHKRANRRVKIVSQVVGNHTYAVSNGWTWATLASKNPKALALDPEPSAPGEEPVVTAVRIVSTDPKAKKAGGLCVALKGQPVSPADEVDSEKEYGLVAYEHESEEESENN